MEACGSRKPSPSPGHFSPNLNLNETLEVLSKNLLEFCPSKGCFYRGCPYGQARMCHRTNSCPASHTPGDPLSAKPLTADPEARVGARGPSKPKHVTIPDAQAGHQGPGSNGSRDRQEPGSLGAMQLFILIPEPQIVS